MKPAIENSRQSGSGDHERQCRFKAYSFDLARTRIEAIVAQDLKCCTAMRVQARKRSGCVPLTVPGGIVPVVENILLNPVDNANTR